MAASEAVTMAIKMDIIIRPVIIHTIQNTRPRVDLGERSPYLQREVAVITLCMSSKVDSGVLNHVTYPTVVMVTSAHQNPSQTPFMND